MFSLNSDGAMGVNLGSDLVMDRQSPTESLTINNTLGINASKADSDADMTHAVSDSFDARYQRFFGGSRGVSAYGSANTGVGVVKDEDASVPLEIGAGAGYGRLVDARSVAQAAAMYEALGRSGSDEDLLRVAEVIGKRSSYSADDVYNGAVNFNAALAEAIGGASATESHQLLQVLDSPIYNVGHRRVGWEVTAGVAANLGDVLSDDAEADNKIAQGFSYGMLLSDSMGAYVSETFSMGLGDDASQKIDIEAGFNLDHSIRHNTTAGLNVDVTLPSEGDTALNWSLGAATNYVVGSNLVASAGLNLGQDQDEDLGWDVRANLTYYLW